MFIISFHMLHVVRDETVSRLPENYLNYKLFLSTKNAKLLVVPASQMQRFDAFLCHI